MNQSKFQLRALPLVLLASAGLLSACGGDGKLVGGQANVVQAPVSGGTCTLASGSGNDPASYTRIVATATSSNGVASFNGVPASSAPLLLTCSGGTYVDETTGKTLAGSTLRSWVVATNSGFTSTVTPLSEMAVQLMAQNAKNPGTDKKPNNGPKAPTEYKKAADQIAKSFGLDGVDITTIMPTPRAKGGAKLGNSAADKFTLALTAISQRAQQPVKNAQTGAATKAAFLKAASTCETASAANPADASCVISLFLKGLAADGSFKDRSVRGELSKALLAAAKDDPTLVSADDLRTVYEQSANADELPTVDYVDASDNPTQMDDSESLKIVTGKTSSIAVVGQSLRLDSKLLVTLNGKTCALHDLERLGSAEVDFDQLVKKYVSAGQPESEAIASAEEEAGSLEEAEQQQITADCPAVNSDGDYPIVVTYKDSDGDETLYSDTMTASSPQMKPKSAAAIKPKAITCPGGGSCTATITGAVTGEKPSINYDDVNAPTSATFDYTKPVSFIVPGVVVELRDANNNVLDTTGTDANGNFSFSGVPDGIKTTVRVNAQITNSSAKAPAGSTYNFIVRDNTAANKDMFFVEQACSDAVAGQSTTCNVTAKLGMVTNGQLDDTDAGQKSRQSAAFSILTVVYSAATNLQTAYTGGENLVMPDLNIYWSSKNVGTTDCGKTNGCISTSHYSGSGDLPGVFILGKASVDTDEFDTGVIGHEFGHYLQAQLSFSDSQGGSHSGGDFKDASLAYGEGYGTAVGGLLTGSPYYIDTAGAQASGGVTNLNKPINNDKNPGFYSEEVVGYVMYQIGKDTTKFPDGFKAFWNAVKAFKGNGDSATIFAFLSRYVAQNPATQTAVQTLASSQNIRTLDAKGSVNDSDAKVTADASKGTDGAATGANDLEKLYTSPMTLSLPATVPATTATATSETFCINRNLKGAQNGNGLGMSKRFTFTPNFSGYVGLKPLNDKGEKMNEQSTSVRARSATGEKGAIFQWDDGYGKIRVQANKEYTVMVGASDPNAVFQGNVCGNTLALFALSNESAQ